MATRIKISLQDLGIEDLSNNIAIYSPVQTQPYQGKKKSLKNNFPKENSKTKKKN